MQHDIIAKSEKVKHWIHYNSFKVLQNESKIEVGVEAKWFWDEMYVWKTATF